MKNTEFKKSINAAFPVSLLATQAATLKVVYLRISNNIGREMEQEITVGV